MRNSKRTYRKSNLKAIDEPLPQTNPPSSLLFIEKFRIYPTTFLQLISIFFDVSSHCLSDYFKTLTFVSNENAFVFSVSNTDSIKHWKRLDRHIGLIGCRCLTNLYYSLRELVDRAPTSFQHSLSTRFQLRVTPCSVGVEGGALVSNSFWATILNVACGYGHLTVIPRVRTRSTSTSISLGGNTFLNCESTFSDSMPCVSFCEHKSTVEFESNTGSCANPNGRFSTLSSTRPDEFDAGICQSSVSLSASLFGRAPEARRRQHPSEELVTTHEPDTNVHLENCVEPLLRATCHLARALHPVCSPLCDRCDRSACETEPASEANLVCPLKRYVIDMDCEPVPGVLPSLICGQHCMRAPSGPLYKIFNKLKFYDVLL